MAINAIEKVKSRPITLIGVALVLIGFLGPVLTGQAGVSAIVKIDTSVDIWHHYPYGSESSPATLSDPTTLSVVEEQGEQLQGVTCDIYRDGTTKIDTVELTTSQDQQGKWTKDWHPPSADTFKFVFEYTDWNGNSGTADGWGIFGADADGDMYINGEGPLNEDSEITLTTRDLSFKFTPTQGADIITGVNVNISGPEETTVDLTERRDVSDWIGSWTADQDGTYTMIGQVHTGSGDNFRVMSISTGVGEPPTQPTPIHWFYWMKIISLPLLVAGVAIEPEIYR